MLARLAWAFNIKKKVNPLTNMEVPLDIKYEPTPNPKPLPFPAVIEARDQEKARIIREEGETGRRMDSLA